MPKRTGRYWREHVVPAVLARDGGICWICGHPGATTADHDPPASKLPPHLHMDLRFLKAAHDRCNRIKRDRTVEYARQRIAKQTTGSSGGFSW